MLAMYILLVRDKSKKPRTTSALEQIHNSSMQKRQQKIIYEMYIDIYTNEGSNY